MPMRALIPFAPLLVLTVTLAAVPTRGWSGRPVRVAGGGWGGGRGLGGRRWGGGREGGGKRGGGRGIGRRRFTAWPGGRVERDWGTVRPGGWRAVAAGRFCPG